MIKKFNIEKKWNIEDFYDLKYFITTHKDEELLRQYEISGHKSESMTLYNYHEPSPMPEVVYSYIRPHFSFLNNVAIAVNLFHPGQYLPIHTDIFGKYIKVYGSDFSNIVRYVMMLEDNSPGQILQISNKCYSNWKSGDCFGWKCDELHAFYNFSMKNRYAIQITGEMK